METINFRINEEYIELCQLLKATGLCGSGGEAKQNIAEGLVQVDGVVETRKKCKINVGAKVMYNNNKIIVIGE